MPRRRTCRLVIESTSTTTVAEAAQTQVTETNSPLSSVFSVRTLVVVLTVIVLLLARFVMPITAWFVRRRRVRSATTRQDLVEIDWDDLTAHLHDLGLPDAGGGTLRQQIAVFVADRYRRAHIGPGQDQVVRIVEDGADLVGAGRFADGQFGHIKLAGLVVFGSVFQRQHDVCLCRIALQAAGGDGRAQFQQVCAGIIEVDIDRVETPQRRQSRRLVCSDDIADADG
jgi:hypothetical protein